MYFACWMMTRLPPPLSLPLSDYTPRTWTSKTSFASWWLAMRSGSRASRAKMLRRIGSSRWQTLMRSTPLSGAHVVIVAWMGPDHASATWKETQKTLTRTQTPFTMRHAIVDATMTLYATLFSTAWAHKANSTSSFSSSMTAFRAFYITSPLASLACIRARCVTVLCKLDHVHYECLLVLTQLIDIRNHSKGQRAWLTNWVDSDRFITGPSSTMNWRVLLLVVCTPSK